MKKLEKENKRAMNISWDLAKTDIIPPRRATAHVPRNEVGSVA